MPTFVASLRGATLLRFAQWMHGTTLGTSQVSMARPTSGTLFQTAAGGVAAEYMVALANAVAADPSFAIPAGATDGYVYAFAGVVHRALDARLRPVFAYGADMLHPGTAGNAWAVMAGHNSHFSGNEQQVAARWYTLRSQQVTAVAQRAFGRDAQRVTRSDAELAARQAFAPNAALRFVATPAIDDFVAPERARTHTAPVLGTARTNLAPGDSGRPALRGDLGAPLRAVDLTREGVRDWVHFGAASLAGARKRVDVAQIGEPEILGGHAAQIVRGTFSGYGWRDGRPQAAQAGVHTAIAASREGGGFALTVPASTTMQTLRVYVSAYRAQGSLRAVLSDGSARPYANDELDSIAGTSSGVYTLAYRAAKDGAQLRVSFVLARAHQAGAHVALEAATLQKAGDAPASAPVSELTFHNDNSRTAWDPNESILTTANVASSKFGKLQTLSVDGVVLAQPLYVAQYPIPSSGVHNLLLVATENDTLYEYDADTLALINKRSFGTPQSSSAVGCGDIRPMYGITSTPVIDPATNILYLVASTVQGSKDVTTIHSVGLGTLKDVKKQKVAAKFKLSNGDITSYNAQHEHSRTSLAYNNGALYVGIGSRCDTATGSIVGWMLKYDGTSLKQTASFPTIEDAQQYLLASIWMTGYASAIDTSGNVFSVIGNGAFDGNTGGKDYGESAIALDPNLTGVMSSFTPSNWQSLNNGDTDFGSGGILLLPTQEGKTPNVAVAMGKDSNLFVLNRDNLGGIGGYMQVLRAGGNGVWGGPAFYSGPTGQYVYYQTDSAPITAYKATVAKSGKFKLTPKSHGSTDAGYGGSSPVVSSNGQQSGSAIVWLVERDSTLTLEAYDATDLTQLLFSGGAGQWTNPENNGFVTPLVANGKVFVPSNGAITVFGLNGSRNVARSGGTGGSQTDRSHRLSGHVLSVHGNLLVLKLRDGRSVNVDITAARKADATGMLPRGGAVTVYGTRDAAGAFHATSVGHASPNLKQWGADE